MKDKPLDFMSRLSHETLYTDPIKAMGTHLSWSGELSGPMKWFEYLSAKDGFLRDKDRSNEFFYIRYDLKSFETVVRPHMNKAKNFLDVGCGAGDKLAHVKIRWPHVKTYGIEHDPAMAIWAGEFGEVKCVDALKCNYLGFDVIYAYWPIADRSKMYKLIDLIMRTKSASAAFILVGIQPEPGSPYRQNANSKVVCV